MSTSKQAPHETFRGTMIADCVAAGLVNGEDLVRDQLLIAEKYRARRVEL